MLNKSSPILSSRIGIPREAELMAFAIVFDDLLAKGNFKNLSEFAQYLGISKHMLSNIMKLRLNPPKKQEEILFKTKKIVE